MGCILRTRYDHPLDNSTCRIKDDKHKIESCIFITELPLTCLIIMFYQTFAVVLLICIKSKDKIPTK